MSGLYTHVCIKGPWLYQICPSRLRVHTRGLLSTLELLVSQSGREVFKENINTTEMFIPAYYDSHSPETVWFNFKFCTIPGWILNPFVALLCKIAFLFQIGGIETMSVKILPTVNYRSLAKGGKYAPNLRLTLLLF